MGIYQRLFSGVPEGLPEAIVVQSSKEIRSTECMRVLKAHVMVADSNNVIVGMNVSVERMLRHAEAAIRKELPAFSVDTLIGSSMDVFHRHPAHQSAILAKLTAAHEANIRMGGREFSLVATPVFHDGERLGTVIEWQDHTDANELKRRQAELQAAEEARARELGIITTALNFVSSNVMMADNDGKIFFANRAVVQLLKQAETDIRKQLPAFSADALIGQSFDSFHRNPAHQRNVLSRLREPFEADIAIGVRRFHLLATPVFGGTGERLATVVEWQDRTDELLMEVDVETTIKAAINGELGLRINDASYSGFIGKMGGSINQLLDVFDRVLKDAGDTLNAMARGNLRKKISNSYQGRYHALKQDINSTIDRLHEVVNGIDSATTEVKNVSQELNLANISLSQRTEEQAASLEQTGAAMEEMTRTLEQNSGNAAVASQLSYEARQAAEEGGKVVSQAIEAMNAISNSSRKIEEITGTIDGIAFQTNLLALNAAVEAARAGEHGRGFAVVAGEVRSLAGLSAKAAKEIKNLIRESGSRVSEGAELVNKSGHTLERIFHAVQKVNDVVNEIAGSSVDQSKGLGEINAAVQEMDAMTQQNAAMVEQATAASDSLFQRAETLNAMMRFFETGSWHS